MAVKLMATQTRQQLLSVIAHSHVTIFTVDRNSNITMLEGALIWDADCETLDKPRWYVGQNVYTVFNRLDPKLRSGQRPEFLKPVESVLSGQVEADVVEHDYKGRWYRTRFLPIHDKQGTPRKNLQGTGPPQGIIGVIMDVTILKQREMALEEQYKAKQRAVASEAAAKEANRLKSQFLANVGRLEGWCLCFCFVQSGLDRY